MYKGNPSETVLDSVFHSEDSRFHLLDSRFCQWNLDSGFQSLVGFWIPWAIFQIPRSRIPDPTSINSPDSGIWISLTDCTWGNLGQLDSIYHWSLRLPEKCGYFLSFFVINIVIIFVDEEHRGGRFFFKAVKEGDQVLFATEEELERQIWVNKLYTATGQSHKPVAPNLSAVSVQPHVSNTLTRLQGGWSRYHCFFRNICYSFKIVHCFWLAPIPG